MTPPRIAIWLEGDYHPFAETADWFVEFLNGNGFAAEKRSLEEAIDQPADLVILGGLTYLATKDYVRPPALLERLEELRKTTPILALHSVLGSWDDIPEFDEFWDGRWAWGLSDHSPYEAFPVRVASGHPITDGFESFVTTDELYYNLRPPHESQVLLEADYRGRHWPLAWANENLVYCGLGHDVAACDQPSVRDFLLRSIRHLLAARRPQTATTAAIIGVGAPKPSAIRGGGHQIGYTHAGMYRRQPRVNLVAAADIDANNLQTFQDANGNVLGYRDYRQMLKEVRPDVVSICTYVGLHREMIEACAEAGVKGVICEKPFVQSPAELAAVRQIAKESGIKLVVTHIRRYLPAFEAAAEAIRSGAIGTPLLGFTGLEGWDLSEMGSHHFDLLRMLFGDREARHVMGQGRVTDARGYGHAMEDHAIAYIEFDGGVRAMIDGGRGFEGGGLSVVGSTGTIHILDERRVEIVGADGRETLDFSHDPRSTWEAIWDRLLGSLLDWTEGGPEPVCGLSSASKTAELNLAAYFSMIRGDRVDLPLVDALDEWPVDFLARRNDRTHVLS